MVCKKSVISKILILLMPLLFFMTFGFTSRAEGPFVAEYEDVEFYFFRNSGTVDLLHENLGYIDFYTNSDYDTYFLLYKSEGTIYISYYCPENINVSCGYYIRALNSKDDMKYNGKADLSTGTGILHSEYLECKDILPSRDDYFTSSIAYRNLFKVFVDNGFADNYKDATIVDTSLVRNDVNFGLQNVKSSCVDNQLTLNWSVPYSMPDALEYPIFIDLLIEDRDTGESAMYFYPATESITLRPSPCDVNDLTYSFDVGNIRDIPENFYIKSVSLTPCYIVHLEYLDMDITYKGQTSHVFLNYSGTDKKPIYQAPVIQTPPDTEIIEEDMPTSIFGAITNFFSGFFNNFGTMLKNLFIPTKEQMQGLFANMENFFSDKLGFLWFPFDLAITIVETFTYGEADSMLTVPPITINILGGIDLYPGGQFDMDEVGIFPYVRIVSSILLACAVAGLAYNKWDEWIGGHDN